MEPEIIFEDNSFLILNKPSGWIVNEARTAKNQPVIQRWIATNFKFPISNDRIFRNGIVHRLDKETSGILIIAKTESAFKNLQSQFKAREVKKEYRALAHGKVEPKTGTIKVPVGRLPWNRERFGVLPGGRAAETNYKVEKYYQKGKENFSLLSLKPKTGRTHQIRIHLKYLGHPIVSDEFYAGRKTARLDRKWCPRLFLHASRISFEHPISKKQVEYRAALSKDLLDSLENLLHGF